MKVEKDRFDKMLGKMISQAPQKTSEIRVGKKRATPFAEDLSKRQGKSPGRGMRKNPSPGPKNKP